MATLTNFDLDTLICDLKELTVAAQERCNSLKREYESERSIGFSLLEEYFYMLNKLLNEKQSYITNNLNNITDLNIKSENIFNKILGSS